MAIGGDAKAAPRTREHTRGGRAPPVHTIARGPHLLPCQLRTLRCLHCAGGLKMAVRWRVATIPAGGVVVAAAPWWRPTALGLARMKFELEVAGTASGTD